MKRLTLSIAAASLFALPHAARSNGTLYTIRDLDDHLIAIDNLTLQMTDIGPLGVPFAFGGLGYDPNSDTLYMIGGDLSPSLYRVNRTTGAATLIGNHGVERLFGLDFDSRNNVIYASQFGPTATDVGLYTLNPTTGAATRIAPIEDFGFGGLSYNSTDDVLIGLAPDLGEIYAINRSTGAGTLLSDGPFVDDNGLAFDLERGLIWAIDFGGNLFSYDPSAAYARTTQLSGLGSHDGLAFVIPEPSSGTLMLCGALLALRRRGQSRSGVL